MPVATDPPVDGRRARRERSRTSVIDAVCALVLEGMLPPTVEQVAERSGVSVSSIFRMFDGLDDMRSQAFEQFERRYAHVLSFEIDTGADRSQRIDRLVRMRVELAAEVGPLVSLARRQAIENSSMAERMHALRARLAEQVRRCFSAEIERLTAVEAANLVAAIDAAVSMEAFELLGAAHARTPRQIEGIWRRSVVALTDACVDPSAEPNHARAHEGALT